MRSPINIFIFSAQLIFAASLAAAPVAVFDTGQRLGNADARAAALGDFNADGRADAVVAIATGSGATRDHYSLQRWLNQGPDSFAAGGTVADPLAVLARDIATGDLNGDGRLDAIVGTTGANRVWVGNSAGILQLTSQALGTGSTAAVALGALDAGTSLDAVFAKSSGGASQVWTNNGSGTFTLKQNLAANSATDVALGDLDGDGDVDIYLVDNSATDGIWLNNGSAVFTSAGNVFDGQKHAVVALGDVNDDGAMDAVVAGQNPNPNGAQGVIKVFRNDSTAHFAPLGSAITLANVAVKGLKLADFDGDGDLDLFVAGAMVSNSAGDNAGNASRLYLNDGAGTFTDSGMQFGGADSSDAALGDLDGDGDVDIYFAKPQLAASSGAPDRIYRSTGQFAADLWRTAYSGGFGNDFLFDSDYDGAGNMIVAGFNAASSFHGTDGYVAKLNPAGTQTLWSAKLDNGLFVSASNTNDHFFGVAADHANRVLVTGGLASAPFAANLQRVVTRQYSTTGSLLWERFYAEGPENSYGNDVAVDSLNNVYVAATVYTDSNVQGRWALLKYNSAGTLQPTFPVYFNASAFTYLRDEPVRLTIDKDNNPIVVGQKGVSGSAAGTANDFDWHVRKVSPTGALIWQDTFGGAAHLLDHASGVASDASGNVYVVGDVNFGTNNTTATAYQAVLIKYSAAGSGGAGQRLWIYTLPMSGNHGSAGYQVVVGPDQNPVISVGIVDGAGLTRLALLRIDRSSGLERQRRIWPAEGFVFGYGMAQRGSVLGIAGWQNIGHGYDGLILQANLAPPPPVITSHGGANFNSSGFTETLAGTRDASATRVRMNGFNNATLLAGNQWNIIALLGPAQNLFQFTATDALGTESAASSITVTRSNAAREEWMLYQ